MNDGVVPSILYQSFGPETNRDYVAALTASVGAAGAAYGATVEVRGTPGTVLAEKQYRAFHLAAGAELLRSVHQGQIDGFDAVVIGNIQDPALYECRQVCRVPVIGMLESLLATTRPFATNVALITTGARVRPLLRERLLLYGDERRVHVIETIDSPLTDIARAFDDSAAASAIVDRFRNAAAHAVSGGAELVAPASGILATLLAVAHGGAAAWDFGLAAPVVNPVWLAVGSAVLAARSARVGLHLSRAGTYEGPPAADLERYLAARRP
jgi:Asp/Glu/hydantoin racemase